MKKTIGKILEKARSAKKEQLIVAIPYEYLLPESDEHGQPTLNFVISILPFVSKVMENYTTPMTARHGSKPFLGILGEPEKILSDKKYMSEFSKKSKDCELFIV